MTAKAVGAAATNDRPKRLLVVVVTAQVVIPAMALLVRITQGMYSTPWGWQMFS